MQTKILIVAVVENENGEVLLRKKPEGSPPYKETWYIFGAELVAGEPLEALVAAHIKKQAGIDVVMGKRLMWDTEVKEDLDGVRKQFVYLDVLCNYVGGELTISPGVEKLEWVEKSRLKDYDNVPPSVELFKKLGYIEGEV